MNIYKNKRHVYLDGGPGNNAPIGAAALPDGDYYFQVTDPPGKTLLSSDGIGSRKFTVLNGVIISADNHKTNEDTDHGDEGAVVVQLFPYDDTPNKGGVYKVWVTPVACWGPTEDDGKHGFIPRYCKTDNFKVKGKIDQFLCVQKFKDCDGDGIWDEDEPEIDGWLITVTEPADPDLPDEPPIQQQHRTSFCIPAWNGIWKVEEEVIWNGCYGWEPTVVYVDGAMQTDPATSAEVTFTGEVTKNEAEIHTVVFGNQPLSSIKVCKFYDLNGNGINDEGIPVPGIKFLLRAGDINGEVIDTQYTDEGGCVSFCKLTGGIYTVEEVLPTNCSWVATTDTYIEGIEVKDCQDPIEIEVPDFGNVITGTACFSTKGYWHNKNGMTELTEANGDILDYVNGLSPYSSPSSYFGAGAEPFDGIGDGGTPVEAAYNNDDDSLIWGTGTWQAEVSHFLVDSNAGGDPKEQLAQQLLAFIFNVMVRLGSVDAVILEPGLYEGSASDLINAAIEAWESGTAAEQTEIKDTLDALNNRDCDPGVEYILPLPDDCIPDGPYEETQ
jgi:hypothetical protein